MALWKPFKGNRSNLDTLDKHDGYVYFCINDGSLFFDYTDADGELQRKQINAKNAETLDGKTFDEIKNELNSSKTSINLVSPGGVEYKLTVDDNGIIITETV